MLEWGQVCRVGSNSVAKVRNYCTEPARAAIPALLSVTVLSLFNNNSSLYVVKMSAQRTQVWTWTSMLQHPSFQQAE